VTPSGDYLHPDRLYYSQKFVEKLGEKDHFILNDKDAPPFISEAPRLDHKYASNCQYSGEGVVCTVPEGHYFMMGDNRDQSADSRFWGFVPDENIVGRAFFVWFHADSILPPSGIRFGRIGSFN
jgi:signal peptidase I